LWDAPWEGVCDNEKARAVAPSPGPPPSEPWAVGGTPLTQGTRVTRAPGLRGSVGREPEHMQVFDRWQQIDAKLGAAFTFNIYLTMINLKYYVRIRAGTEK